MIWFLIIYLVAANLMLSMLIIEYCSVNMDYGVLSFLLLLSITPIINTVVYLGSFVYSCTHQFHTTCYESVFMDKIINFKDLKCSQSTYSRF
jgi:hypothetical protein